jgi:hypothetical protein
MDSNTVARHDSGDDDLSPLAIWTTIDGRVDHRRVGEQHLLHL